jgi:aconitase B
LSVKVAQSRQNVIVDPNNPKNKAAVTSDGKLQVEANFSGSVTIGNVKIQNATMSLSSSYA